MASTGTCSVGGRAVAQLVADYAGEVATHGSLGHNQCRSILGDCPHSGGDGGLLVEPAEAGVRAPGLATHQRRVSNVDAE